MSEKFWKSAFKYFRKEQAIETLKESMAKDGESRDHARMRKNVAARLAEGAARRSGEDIPGY
jgi:hypothetical protein